MAKTARGMSDLSVTAGEESSATESPRTRPTEEEIAVRAYHIYLERDGAEGNPAEDWLQAERELTEAQ